MTLAKLTDKQKEECCRWLDSKQIDNGWASRRYGVTKQHISTMYSEWSRKNNERNMLTGPASCE